MPEKRPEQRFLTGIRPYLSIATICEKYILEQNGALTLFRIIDRFTITGNTPEMPAAQLSFFLVVVFRAGEFLGALDLRITMESESHIAPPMPETVMSVNFEAPPEKPVQVIGQMIINVTEPGLYWVVVRLAEEECTRIPLRIVYQRTPTFQTGVGG